jgi:DNA repair protein RecO (recombination protein O)
MRRCAWPKSAEKEFRVKKLIEYNQTMTDQSTMHRARSFRVEAVVLRHSEWGEADRLLTLFTQELGKVRALAKGARKPRSRKAGHLEPFTHSSLQLARGRELLLVTQADTIDPYTALRDDLMLTTHAAYAVELLDRFTYEEGENRPLYRLLVDTLGRLNSCAEQAMIGNPIEPDVIIRYYEMRLLDLVGFRPQLFQCANGGEEIQPEDQFFSAEAGGVLCPKCGSLVTTVRPVTLQALKYMRHFQRSSFNEAARAQMSTVTSREVESLMQYYLTYLLERGLNTPAFLRRLRQEKASHNP